MAEQPKKFTLPDSSSFQKVEPGESPGTFSTPPPAASREGLPLPPGQPIKPKSLTELERKQLESIGWQEGQAIPGDLPQTLEQVRKEIQEDVENPPPPVHPSTPPLKVPEIVQVEDLPPHKQAEVQAVLQRAEVAARTPPPAPLPPDMSGSVAAAARGEIDREINIEDDREERREQQEPQRVPEQPTQTAADAGDDSHLCKHCGWDNRQEDLVVLTEADRSTFFQATLGGIPWQKRYELFGGLLVVAFRQLTTKEVDSIYQDVYELQKEGVIEKPEDTWEYINRFRICLQIVSVLSDSGLNYTFAESLNEWGCRPREVAEAMYSQVLNTESMSRIVSRQATLFNRAVVKLEDQVDVPGFWTGIETRS